MTQIMQAVFDGEVILPDETISLAPNTRVRIIIETLPAATPAASFLELAVF